jgi:signal transduction histidine kinase
MPPTLLRRLLLVQVVAIVVVWATSLAWAWIETRRFATGDFDLQMSYFARGLADATQEDRDDLARVARSAKRFEALFLEAAVNYLDDIPGYRATYQIRSAPDGRVLYRSDAAPDAPLADRALGFSEQALAEGRARVFGVRSENGAVEVHVAESLAVRDRMTLPVLQLTLYPLTVMLPLLLLATWLGARNAWRPLRAFATQLGRRTHDDLSPIDVPITYREMQPIVEEMNSLLVRLRGTIERERGFLADAAHELRTPLAVVQTQAAVMAGATDPVERDVAHAALRDGLARAATLLRQLLTLARLGGEAYRPRVARIALDEFLQQRLAEFAPRAIERDIELSLEVATAAGASPLVEGDTESLRSMVDNLVDNALRYGARQVDVTAQFDAGASKSWQLVVQDDGPGLTAEERARAFDRFWRGAGGAGEPGSGLGLSIVQRVARVHGGDVVLEAVEPKGLRVVVTLPLGGSRSLSPER